MTITARGWSLIAGPLTLWFLARYLTPFDQGIYYTFHSILAARVFFELGVGNVVLLAASHEKALLSWDSKGMLTGEANALARLSQLFRSSIRFHAAAALLVLLVLMPVGYAFLGKGIGANDHWQVPWVLLCVIGSVSLGSACVVSLLEGCGLVAKIARVRLLAAIAMTAATWLTLSAGGGLYAGVFAVLADLAVMTFWLVITKRNVILQLLRPALSVANVFSWKREVWPMQWRAAISFSCGYLMLQLFNPLLFHFRGPEEAGRMGMSLNLALAALTIALAWINTKAAPFGHLIAQRRWEDLDKTFFRALLQSTFVFLSAGVALFLLVLSLNAWAPAYAERLLDPGCFAILLVAMLGNQIWWSFVVYLRAHKRDPFVVLTLISAIATAGGSLAVADRFGASGLMLVYALVTWIVGVGYGFLLFRKLREQWHAPVDEVGSLHESIR